MDGWIECSLDNLPCNTEKREQLTYVSSWQSDQ